MSRRFRIPARFLTVLLVLMALLALLVGCATPPASRPAPARPHATLDEAATAGLVAARASTPRHRRASIQIGTLRRVEGGFVAMPPQIAEGSVLDAAPSVLRLALTPADVALYVVHPRSGAGDVDERSGALSASERRMLGSREGTLRPVYLLTPRLEVVRYALDRPATRIARLRSTGSKAAEGLLAAARD